MLGPCACSPDPLSSVHSHHGALPEQDTFDHQLIWQAPDLPDADDLGDPSRTVDLDRAKGMVHPEWRASRQFLRGRMDNGDHWLSLGEPKGPLSLERPV